MSEKSENTQTSANWQNQSVNRWTHHPPQCPAHHPKWRHHHPPRCLGLPALSYADGVLDSAVPGSPQCHFSPHARCPNCHCPVSLSRQSSLECPTDGQRDFWGSLSALPRWSGSCCLPALAWSLSCPPCLPQLSSWALAGWCVPACVFGLCGDTTAAFCRSVCKVGDNWYCGYPPTHADLSKSWAVKELYYRQSSKKVCVALGWVINSEIQCWSRRSFWLALLNRVRLWIKHSRKYRSRTERSFAWLPSKHAGSDSHLIRIGSEALAKSGPDDCCTPACFRIGSVSATPDTVGQNQMGSSLALHNMIRAVCGRTQPSLKVRNW